MVEDREGISTEPSVTFANSYRICAVKTHELNSTEHDTGAVNAKQRLWVMSITLKAIYKNGAFVPVANSEKLNVREKTEVELTVHDPRVLPATAKNDEEPRAAQQSPPLSA